VETMARFMNSRDVVRKKVLRLTQEMKLTRQSQTSQVIPGRSKGSPLVSRRGATRWPIRARRHVVVLHGNAARAGGDVELFHRRSRYATFGLAFPKAQRRCSYAVHGWGSRSSALVTRVRAGSSPGESRHRQETHPERAARTRDRARTPCTVFARHSSRFRTHAPGF